MGSFYVQHDGQQYGPITREELQQYFDEGALVADDWAIEEGGADWVPLGGLVEMAAVIPDQFQEAAEIVVQIETTPEASASDFSAQPEIVVQVETPAIAPGADVSVGRKRVALMVLVVGLLGGGTTLGLYLWPKKNSATPPGPSGKLAEKPKPIPPAPAPPKPKTVVYQPPPVPLPLEIEGLEKFDRTAAAAKAGDSQASLQMAFCALEGWGLAPDRERAIEHAETAGQSPTNHSAKLFLAFLYVSGRTAPDKLARAGELASPESIHAVEALADAGDAEAQFVLGLRTLPRRAVPGIPGFSGDWRQSKQRLQQAAAQGQALAQCRLGRLAQKKNPRLTARCFAAAAQQGHSEALRQLGLLYLAGRGVDKNITEAVRLTRESALLGNGQARFMMGRLLDEGRVVSENKIEACQWFLLAAPKNPAARKHAVRLNNELELEQFAEAVKLAKALEKDLKVPEFVPLPPRVAKPMVAMLGVIEKDANANGETGKPDPGETVKPDVDPRKPPTDPPVPPKKTPPDPQP
jgi:TPR repeat protein